VIRWAAIALALLGASAHADTLGIHVGSQHSRAGFNNLNPGVYFRAETGETAGAYLNSTEKLSLYAGYTLTGKTPVPEVSYSLGLGVITGYTKPVMLLVAPSLHYGPVRLTFIPHTVQTQSAVVHLSLEFKI
jgi:hypothetical protein